jgi:hypothetical protein
MKKFASAILVVIISIFNFFLFGCNHKTMILERKYIYNLNIEEKLIGGTQVLTVSGFSGHSALGIRVIEYVYDGNKIIMLISLGLGGNGNFSEKIKLSPQISQLLIGEKREIIWDKSASGRSNTKKISSVTHMKQMKIEIKIKNKLKELQSRQSKGSPVRPGSDPSEGSF